MQDEHSLDPDDWTDLRALGHRILDDLFDGMASVRERPVWQQTPGSVRQALRSPLPRTPETAEAVYAAVQELVVPYVTGNTHPRFMGWVHGGGNPVGVLAEMIAAALNANLGGRDHAPIEVERQVIDWAAEMVGMPAETSGLLVTGTSVANLIAVLVARRAAAGAAVRSAEVGIRRLTAYAAWTAHGCIARAMDMAGLGTDALRLIACDTEHRIDLAQLATAVARDRAAGLQPFLVVGTAGTVDVGAVDDLVGLSAFCRAEELWSTWTAHSAPSRPCRPASARCWPASSGRTAWRSTSTNGRRFPTTPGACWSGMGRCSERRSPRPSTICGARSGAWRPGIPGHATSARTCRAGSGR